MKNDRDAFIWGYTVGRYCSQNHKPSYSTGGHGLEWIAVAIVVGIPVLSVLIFGG